MYISSASTTEYLFLVWTVSGTILIKNSFILEIEATSILLTRVFTLWLEAKQIYWNKAKCLYKEKNSIPM